MFDQHCIVGGFLKWICPSQDRSHLPECAFVGLQPYTYFLTRISWDFEVNFNASQDQSHLLCRIPQVFSDRANWTWILTLHKIKFARSSHLQECVFMGFGMRTTKRMCQLSMQCAEVLKVRIARIVVTIGGKIGTLPWGHFSFVGIISLQTEIPWEILQRSLKLGGGERQHNRRENIYGGI